MPELINKETLLQFPKERLLELLLVSLEATRISSENALNLAKHMATLQARVQELQDQNDTKEAELIALRARP